MFNDLYRNPKHGNFICDIRQQWVYSKMTNMNDATQPDMYFYLEQVEYQEFICRVTFEYFGEQKEVNPEFEIPELLEDRLYIILEIMWKAKVRRNSYTKQGDTGKKIKKWPDLERLPEES